MDPEVLGCTELTPHAIALESTPTKLDLRILLDRGAEQATAQKAVTAMRKAYDPLEISVEPSYEKVSFSGVDAESLNKQAKDHFGGKRPAGIDVVYTMTTKDIKSAGLTGDNVAGLADCIGGIRHDDRAFAVGEVIPDGESSLLGVPLPLPLKDATGKTMAHEIGHLLGGHHHYSSPEGLLAPSGPNALSLMGPHLSLISLKFSTLNSTMVQGHTQLYGGN